MYDKKSKHSKISQIFLKPMRLIVFQLLFLPSMALLMGRVQFGRGWLKKVNKASAVEALEIIATPHYPAAFHDTEVEPDGGQAAFEQAKKLTLSNDSDVNWRVACFHLQLKKDTELQLKLKDKGTEFQAAIWRARYADGLSSLTQRLVSFYRLLSR